ncbi:MAG: hypothetical protein OTJ43_09825 [Dehalococcoidia bacterium]|nr:hypothetical protein [Dehalococcoidia bacterium]
MLKLRIVTFAILLLLVVAVGCSSSDQAAIDKAVSPTLAVAQPTTAVPAATAAPAAAPTPVLMPAATSVPTSTSTPIPTATPLPTATSVHVAVSTPVPSPTPLPTSTPSPTPTPTATPVFSPSEYSQVNDPLDSPPYYGTLFVSSEILIASDPSTFEGLTAKPGALRKMYDRRHGFVELTPHLFEATFSDGFTVEVQINPEFTDPDEVLAMAKKYSEIIGKIPTYLRTMVETVWIHDGDELFGGGGKNLLIHTIAAEGYEKRGILEEVFLHEASHTSLDDLFKADPDWLKAQSFDGQFISTYAAENPGNEDVAESLPMYFAIRHRPDRISETLQQNILKIMPNRIFFFDTHLPSSD